MRFIIASIMVPYFLYKCKYSKRYCRPKNNQFWVVIYAPILGSAAAGCYHLRTMCAAAEVIRKLI